MQRIFLNTAPTVVWSVVAAQLCLLLPSTERDVLIENVHTQSRKMSNEIHDRHRNERSNTCLLSKITL